MTPTKNLFLILGLCAVLSILTALSCERSETASREAEASITKEDLERHVKALSSDDFEGRRPFTDGEIKTLRYIQSAFEQMGLSGGYNGKYFQDVPLVEVTMNPSKNIRFNTANGSLNFLHPIDFIASTHRTVENIALKDSELVFAGYGIAAPEFSWNDYENADVKGKTVIVLVNDPGFTTQDDALFKGNTMTYYGRWTYKYEEAARRGAEGIIIVHDTAPAGYPWSVLQNGAGSSLYLQSADHYMSRCALEGWITLSAARKLFKQCGKDFDTLAASACGPGFEAVPLNAGVSFSMKNRLKKDLSRNVLALCPGTDRADECVVYTAHWDHLGVDRALAGDTIYNGCADNACAVAWLLETAEAFSRLGKKPSRSMLFLAVTAEESGLLGSDYYADHPAFPMEKTVAVINMDILPLNGKMKDVTITGFGQSELDDYVSEAAKRQGRYVMPDPDAHNGMYFRSDHFSFARRGVPGLFAKGFSDHAEHGKAWARRKMAEYWTKHYHQPSDEYDPDTADFGGLLADTKLLFDVGLKLGMENAFPAWKEGSEFKAIRDKELK